MFKYNNFVIVISSPSGAGKSTLVNKILMADDNIKVSISATTREPRIGEIDGIHYHFLSPEEFQRKIKNNDFVEYANVHENCYGTLKSELESKWQNNYDVILNIDWQGGQSVTKQIPKDKLLKIFILPPSFKELEKRLIDRQQDSVETIRKRLAKAREEILHYNEYDFVVVNDNLDTAFQELMAIILVKRKQNVYQKHLESFVKNLLI